MIFYRWSVIERNVNYGTLYFKQCRSSVCIFGIFIYFLDRYWQINLDINFSLECHRFTESILSWILWSPNFSVIICQWLQWHHSAHVLLVGTSDGDMWMWKIPGGECKTFQSHGTQSLCGKVLPDGKSLIIFAKVLNIKSIKVDVCAVSSHLLNIY